MGLESAIQGQITPKKALKYLRRIFHLDQSSDKSTPVFEQIQRDVDAFMADNSHLMMVELEQVSQVIFRNLLLILQDHCMFEIYPFYSRDRDEIFIKLRASEEALKVQADLDDYHLQMTADVMDIQVF